MAQREMDFGVCATPSCNHFRRLNAPPVADADGLFDADGVAILCGRRQCWFEVTGVDAVFGTVQFKDAKVTLTALAPGRWIRYRCCRHAPGRTATKYSKSTTLTVARRTPAGSMSFASPASWAPTASGPTDRGAAACEHAPCSGCSSSRIRRQPSGRLELG